jgi:hypothetical protein
VALTRCFDAAFPPAYPPSGAGAVLGYVSAGGLDRNYRTWLPSDWLPFKNLRQYPVWEVNIGADPRQSARNAVASMRELGWNVGRALVGAMETYIDPHWWLACEQEIEALGQWPVCYGSASTVYGNHARQVWEAHYDGRPDLPPPPAVAKQYMSGGALDWSVLAPALLERGGEGPRKQP